MKDIYIADLANFDEGKLFDGFFQATRASPRTSSAATSSRLAARPRASTTACK
jgi:hypothetical protein